MLRSKKKWEAKEEQESPEGRGNPKKKGET